MSIIPIDKNIYRLIKPFQSDKVYEAKTTMHGAGKCYKELKAANIKCDSFTIQNLADNTTFDFKVDSKPKLESLIIHSDRNKIQNGGSDIDKVMIENRLKQIESRLNVLESKVESKVESKIKL